jgi:hypothetical protein
MHETRRDGDEANLPTLNIDDLGRHGRGVVQRLLSTRGGEEN